MTEAQTHSRPVDGLRRTAARVQRRATALWHAHPRETLCVGLLCRVAVSAIAATAVTPSLSGSAQAAPPAPPAMIVQPLAPEQALKVNAEIPVANGPNPVAAPFVFKGSAAARAQALSCLA